MLLKVEQEKGNINLNKNHVTRILITGKNSYIGNAFNEWISKNPTNYEIAFVSTRDNEWQNKDFSDYDVILHVAGIAHQDTKEDQEDLYYSVNRDLTVAIAEKAKKEGIKQFIFLSSMIVYGSSSKLGEDKLITALTVPNPVNFYGNSKLQAEKKIMTMQSEIFNVVVIRPPMIYGKGSKGNYPILAKFSKKTPIFPNIENRRSMLYIDNLSEFIRLLIKNKEYGIFFPQNSEYVNTSEMVKLIAKTSNKHMILTKVFNPAIRLLGKQLNLITKVFGNSAYDQSMSHYKENYRVVSFEESIQLTEEKNQ